MNKRTLTFAAFLMLIFTLSWTFPAVAQEGIIYLPLIGKNSSGTVPRPTPTATTVPDWPEMTLDLVADGFNQPIHLTNAGDGSNRLFVTEREGTVRIIDGNGQLQTTPFLDIVDRVECCDSELGLFALAFPPTSNRHFYVHYTARVDGQIKSRVSRFHHNGRSGYRRRQQ